MTYQGKVKNGVVVFETDAPPPDGTLVNVEPVVATENAPDSETSPANPADEELSSWVDVVLKHAGCMDGLPADFAAEHDHYIHGTPKRSQSSK